MRGIATCTALSAGTLFNVDGVVRGSLHPARVGGVLKDSDGVTKAMFSKPVGVTDAISAELVAIKEALKIFVSSK